MAGSGGSLPPLVACLEEVANWRDLEERTLEDRLVALKGDEVEARRQLEDLQKKVETVVAAMEEVEAKLQALDQAEVSRTRTALHESLTSESVRFEAHARIYDDARATRARELQERLESPEIAPLVKEHEQFDEVLATLSSLPEGYRRAIREHHDTVRRRLQPIADLAQAHLPVATGATEPISILASADLRSGAGGVQTTIQVVAPIPHGVHSDLDAGRETLGTILVLRIVAALSGATRELKAPLARAHYDSYGGFLNVRLDLGDVDVDIAKSVVSDELDRMRGDAHELAVAGLTVFTVWLSPELLDDGQQEGAIRELKATSEVAHG